MVEQNDTPEVWERPLPEGELFQIPGTETSSVEGEPSQQIKENCEMCQTLKCCPEHCCDWDTCVCTDCDDCGARKPKGQRPGSAYRVDFNPYTWKNEYIETDEPEFIAKPTGEEKIEQVKQKKKILLTQADKQRDEEERAQKEYHETLPQEVVHLEEGALIRNFEVDYKEEVEVAMIGGIKGIRALRMQRDYLNDVEQKEEAPKDYQGNQFGKYEEESKD